MLFFRIEHPETLNGPFTSARRKLRHLYDNEETNVHPLPTEDELMRDEWNNKNGYDWVFCFATRQQFLNWFTEESQYEALDADGFVMRVYDVHWIKDRILGKTQAAFRRYKAKLKYTYSIKEFASL